MKINITFQIEIEPDRWAENNGVSRVKVREDIKEYVRHHAYLGALIEESGGEVRMK